MAQLNGGTTIAGYLAIHAGNLDEQNIATKGFGGAGENIKVLVNQDLNTIQTTGNYLAENSTNAPETGWGFLIVSAYNDGSTSTRIFQIYKHDITNKIYYRHYSSSWSTWVNIANFSDIPTKTSQITNDGDGTSNFVTANQLGNAGYGDMTKAQYDTNNNGAVDKADKLATARTISLSTDVSGSASFDGNANITIPVTVTDNSHNHISANISDATNANTANMIVKRDASGNFSAGTITSSLSGNASTASKLQTARSIGLTGDVSGSGNFDGTSNLSITANLSNTGITAGTYKSVTVDAKGRITSGSNPNTRDGFGLTDIYTKTEVDNKTSLNRVDITGQTLDINNLNLSTGSPNIQLYICKTVGGSANISNIPISNTNFILNVELIRYNGSSDYCTRQSFTDTSVKNTYIRFCISGTWSSWSQIALKTDLQRITQDTSTQPTNQSTGGVWLKPV